MQDNTLGAIEARNVERLAGLSIASDPARRTVWERRLATTWGAGTGAEWEMGQPICRGCKKEIDASPVSLRFNGTEAVFPTTLCDDCMEAARTHYSPPSEAAGAAVSLTPKWDENCPPRFAEVIAGEVALPGVVDAQAFKRVSDWRPSDGKGLALVGAQGSGKSLSLWSLARELEREGYGVVVLNGVEFGRILAKAARDLEAVDWLVRCRVLAIDDLGKEKATAAVGALMWEVFDQRYQRRAPVVITTRFSGEALRDRFNEPHLGDDIRRRLNELCRAVQFHIATPSP